MVARNKKTPVQVLERLAEDNNTYVRSWSSREQLFAPVRCLIEWKSRGSILTLTYQYIK